MFERVARGFSLLRRSWDVIRADRELLVLPVLSALSALALLVLLFLGILADDLDAIRAGGTVDAPTTLEWVAFALAGYAITYLTIFFNVAIICAADERMRGGDPTVRGALADARRHARAIAPWALVSIVVSTVIRAIQDRGGIVGRIAGSLLGVAWVLVTYLVLPVLVLEGVGVREAIGRSKELFTRTWGETVSGEIGMSVAGFLAALIAAPFLMLLAGGGDPAMVAVAVVLGVAWLLIVATALSALNAVFRVALYRYATDGAAPAGFEDVDLAHVFPEKRRSRTAW